MLRRITNTCSHPTYSHTQSDYSLGQSIPSLPAHLYLPQIITTWPNQRRQLQEFRRLPGLQLLFFLCQLLILLRRNCDLAISNLIVRSFANAIAITSGLSFPSYAQSHPYYPVPSHAPQGPLHSMRVICPGPRYLTPFALELYCCLH